MNRRSDFVAKKTSKKPTAARSTKKKTTKKKAPSAKAASTAKVSRTSKKKTVATAAKKVAKKTAKKPAPAKAAPAGKAPRAAASTNGHSKTPGAGLPPDEFTFRRLSDEELRAVKTGLSRKDLQHFRAVLLEKRAEIFGDVQGMQEARNNANGGENSHMPLHMADVGSDNYEQEFTLGLMESERKTLVEIDDALERIQKSTYGVCIDSGKVIPRERLDIKPWAKYCIEVARERERRGLL